MMQYLAALEHIPDGDPASVEPLSQVNKKYQDCPKCSEKDQLVDKF